MLSDYINVLFDEGQAFGLVNFIGKKLKKAVSEMTESKKERQKLFESLTEILQQAEYMHKVIKYSSSLDEMKTVSEQEDFGVIDYHLRIEN